VVSFFGGGFFFHGKGIENGKTNCFCNESEVFYKIEKRKTKRSTCVCIRFVKDFVLQGNGTLQ